jgi:hypothetical protein
MKLIIDIPEKNFIKDDLIRFFGCYSQKLDEVIRNGTPLPKGHGRILDEKDILDTENNDGGWYDLVDMPEYIAGVKAIIEADKEQDS